MDSNNFDLGARLVWECDDCGTEYELDALEDLDQAACELCQQMATVARKTRNGYRRGRRRQKRQRRKS